MFQGSMTALVTPMHEDGSLDKKSFQELIEWQISSKTDALIIVGTTGESATLDHEEQAQLIHWAIKQAAGRIPIIAGCGTNSTRSTIELTLNAQKLGAQAGLLITPYYNKPTQDGLYRHFKRVTEETDLPLILYNNPGRTGCDLLPETIQRLSELPQIIGVKEATGDLERAKEIIKRCPNPFALYSGVDEINLELMQLGAQGSISVTANIAPAKMAALCALALKKDWKAAEALNQELSALNKKLFLESNPIPSKWALHQMGLIPPGIRLPLTTLHPKYHPEVNSAMQQAGVVNHHVKV